MVVKLIGHEENSSSNSLLDTYSRIIQKNQIKLIDVNEIKTNQKRANIIALEQYIGEIKNEF